MTDQELLQAMKAMLTEANQELRQDIMQDVTTMMAETKQDIMQDVTTMLAETKQDITQNFTAMLTETKQDLRQDIMQDVTTLMDAEFKSKFNLLAEGQQAILDHLPDPEDIETTEHRLSVLELSVKKLNREVKQLKAANE